MGHGKYSGRYFSIILAELARSEPKSFAGIIGRTGLKLPKQHMKGLSAGELTIDLEWSFPNKRKRADLAFYLDREHPILLIEIKDEDGLTKSNAAQLKDYVSFIQKMNGEKSKREDHCHFLLLSRYIPREDDASQIQIAKSKKLSVRQLRHGQIHNWLGSAIASQECSVNIWRT
jgi:Type I restriction enzyme R protein N terminus (HSDR_N)